MSSVDGTAAAEHPASVDVRANRRPASFDSHSDSPVTAATCSESLNCNRAAPRAFATRPPPSLARSRQHTAPPGQQQPWRQPTPIILLIRHLFCPSLGAAPAGGAPRLGSPFGKLRKLRAVGTGSRAATDVPVQHLLRSLHASCRSTQSSISKRSSPTPVHREPQFSPLPAAENPPRGSFQ